MAHEAKLHGPIHSTFEALVVRHVVRYCGELGPFCWPVLASASVHPLNLLGVLLTCNGFTRIQKAIVDQMSSRPPNSDQDFFFFFFFGACLTLGSALELLLSPVQPLSWSLPFVV